MVSISGRINIRNHIYKIVNSEEFKQNSMKLSSILLEVFLKYKIEKCLNPINSHIQVKERINSHIQERKRVYNFFKEVVQYDRNNMKLHWVLYDWGYYKDDMGYIINFSDRLKEEENRVTSAYGAIKEDGIINAFFKRNYHDPVEKLFKNLAEEGSINWDKALLYTVNNNDKRINKLIKNNFDVNWLSQTSSEIFNTVLDVAKNNNNFEIINLLTSYQELKNTLEQKKTLITFEKEIIQRISLEKSMLKKQILNINGTYANNLKSLKDQYVEALRKVKAANKSLKQEQSKLEGKVVILKKINDNQSQFLNDRHLKSLKKNNEMEKNIYEISDKLKNEIVKRENSDSVIKNEINDLRNNLKDLTDTYNVLEKKVENSNLAIKSEIKDLGNKLKEITNSYSVLEEKTIKFDQIIKNEIDNLKKLIDKKADLTIENQIEKLEKNLQEIIKDSHLTIEKEMALVNFKWVNSLD